jgi:hypothetical protein
METGEHGIGHAGGADFRFARLGGGDVGGFPLKQFCRPEERAGRGGGGREWPS